MLHCFILLQIKTVCTTTHIIPLVRIVVANSTLIELITPKLKPGPGLPKNIYKIRRIFLELSKDTEFEKFLYGKTQNAIESLNGTIWECFPKNTFITLPNLEFGAYDAVAHFISGMKV